MLQVILSGNAMPKRLKMVGQWPMVTLLCFWRSWAHRLEIAGASQCLQSVWDFMENYFYEPAHNAYADERDESLQHLSDYRGQNANMHSVEACLAAYEATAEQKFFDRADLIAHQFTVTLAKQADGQIWGHYDANWQHDWVYNIDKPDDLFKP